MIAWCLGDATESNPQDALVLQSWTLSYLGESAVLLEDMYAQRRKQKVLRSIAPGALSAAMLCLIWYAARMLLRKSALTYQRSVAPPQLTVWLVQGVLLTLCAAVYLFAKSRFGERRSPLFWDITLAIFCGWMIFAACCMDVRWVARAWGWNEKDLWPDDSFSSSSLVLDLMCLLVCLPLFLPLRPATVAVDFVLMIFLYGWLLVWVHEPSIEVSVVRGDGARLILAAIAVFAARHKVEKQERLLAFREWDAMQVRAVLTTERNSLMGLVDIVCDAHAWLGEDGDTILEGRIDGEVDILCSKRLRGLLPLDIAKVGAKVQFSQLLASPDEQRRFKQVVDATLAASLEAYKPATLLRVKLLTLCGDQKQALDADLYLFQLQGCEASQLPQRHQQQRVLVGIKVTHLPESTLGTVESRAEDTHYAANQAGVCLSMSEKFQGMRGGHRSESVSDVNLDHLSATHEEDQSCEDEMASASGTSTTWTGRQFQLEDPQERLAQLCELGDREHWLIKREELFVYSPDVLLGEGGFGRVVAASFLGTPVALKQLKDTATSTTVMRRLDSVSNELRILRQVRHPNVVLLHGASFNAEQRSLSLVLELVDGVSMLAFIKGLPTPPGQTLSDRLDRFCTLVGIARALRYLHERRPCIVHGDLKASNIMVERSPTMRARSKILDFGLSRILTRHARPLGGTISWMAPELLQGGGRPPANPSADVFSFGRLVHFAVTGELPARSTELKEAVAAAMSPLVLQWPGASPMEGNAKRMVAEACLFNPQDRPTMKKVSSDLDRWPEALERHSLPAVTPDAPASGPARTHVSEVHRPQRAAAGASSSSRRAVEESSATSPASGSVLVASARPTPHHTQLMLIIELLQRCNVLLPPSRCCDFHGALQVTLDSCKQLLMGECVAEFRALVGGQCQGCFALQANDDSENELCRLCDSVGVQARRLEAL